VYSSTFQVSFISSDFLEIACAPIAPRLMPKIQQVAIRILSLKNGSVKPKLRRRVFPRVRIGLVKKMHLCKVLHKLGDEMLRWHPLRMSRFRYNTSSIGAI
jgi:hypothetical protein